MNREVEYFNESELPRAERWKDFDRLSQDQCMRVDLIGWGQYPARYPQIPKPLFGFYEDGFYESMTFFGLLVRYIYLGEYGAWTELNRRWFERMELEHLEWERQHHDKLERLRQHKPGAARLGEVLMTTLANHSYS